VKIKVVQDKISKDELVEIGKEFYVSMIKGVVDSDIWGFNVIFEKEKDSWIEYISLINIRPQAGNMNMEVQDNVIRDKMKKIINSKII